MTELKERNQIEQQYKWDLSTLFENDEDWNEALTKIDILISEAASFQGKLNNTENLLAYLHMQCCVIAKIQERPMLRVCIPRRMENMLKW